MPKGKANGEGSIVKLSNGKYKGTVTVEVIWNPNNTVKKQVRKSFTHEKKGEVQKWLNEQISQKNNGTLVSPRETTIKQWIENWLEKYKKNKLKTRTYESYDAIIKNHIIPAIGKKRLQDLRTKDLQELYTKKVNEGKSPQTIRHIHIIIHSSLKQALKENLIPRNVADFCELPEKIRPKVNVMTLEELKQLLEANKNHKFYPLLLLEIGTGLRASELLGLHWHNLDLDKGSLFVGANAVETKAGVKYQNTPKTKQSIRLIQIPEEARRVLLEYQEKTKHDNSDIVFPNESGGYMRVSTLTQIFKYTWLKKANLKGFTFHSLRHAHATQLLQLGIHPKVVQQRLGHSTITITMDTYSHVIPQLQQEAADKINTILL